MNPFSKQPRTEVIFDYNAVSSEFDDLAYLLEVNNDSIVRINESYLPDECKNLFIRLREMYPHLDIDSTIYMEFSW